ncbi:MAG TPA: hypothetical protein VIN39_10035 [Candidatus Dormibacteraeota bacterium]|jgi:hypothetical protein
MYPCEVSGNQLSDIGPATCFALLQVAPPSVDEMNPALSWQVETVHSEFG